MKSEKFYQDIPDCENKYIIVFIDDYSRYAKAYAMKLKKDAGECLEKFLAFMRNLIDKNKKVCYIRADNTGEYIGGIFSEVMKTENI